MEGKPEPTIKDFVKAVNEKIDKDSNFKNDLNEAVTKYLLEKKTYFDTLDAFIPGLLWMLYYILNKKEIKAKLGKDWENFEIKYQDLQELYNVNLVLATKNAMIATLNIEKSGRKKLSTDQEISRAFGIWKKILGEDKVSVIDFHSFIRNNFEFQSLSSKNMDDIIDYVTTENKKNKGDKFIGWNFWNVCATLKEQPSKKFIDFMVQNTDFNSLNLDCLICTIIILMRRHSEYLKSQSEDNIVKALGDILDGNKPYEEFSKALLAVPDIEKKIGLKSLISTDDRDIHGFARTLAYRGIKIELVNQEGATSKFVVKEEEYSFKGFEANQLVKLLEQEPELNQWIKDVFTLDKENVVNEDAKNHSLIGKIASMGALISAKAKAIKSFITESKDRVRLQNMYGELLNDKNTELLSSVKLDNKTVEWALAALHNFFSKDGIIQFDNDDANGSIAQLKKFIENWKKQVTGSDNPVSVSVSLSSFIWRFQGKFSRDDFDKLLNLNIWELSENTLYGYALSNILSKVKDGCISDKFLKMIKDRKSVDFSNLWNDKDKYFGRCLFDTIYQLIRTSENYDSKDPEKQKQAIWDVLEKGEKYQWFREGLKTFFQKAKDGKNRTAKDINMKDILKEIPDLAKLLQNCKMKLKFEYNEENPENSTLKVEETKLVMDEKIEIKEEIKKDNIEDTEITKEALPNLANDENLPAYIAQYNYENVTTLKELKQNVLKAFIGSNEEKTKKYKLLKDEDLENCKLPSNVIDDLLFHLPSHKIQIKDNLNEMITASSNSNKKALNEGLEELKKLYGKHGVSSAGALYFMAACSENSLTIKQQDEILHSCKHEKNKDENNIINENNDDKEENENDDNKSKSLAKPTFSKALAALESIKDNAPITSSLINFICDNVDFEKLEYDQEIDNFYGIVYHLIAHNNVIITFLQTKNEIRLNTDFEKYKNAVKSVFSVADKENINKQDIERQAPYKKFWQKIKASGKSFLTSLSNKTIQAKSENEENVYAQKLNNLLNDLKVEIEVKEGEISVQSVKMPVKKEPKEEHENDKTKKSKFPTWAKYLIGFGIAAVAVLALLFGCGVLGALAGTALMVARIVAVLALFAELIYLAVLYAMSQDNKNPGGSRGPGSGSQTTEISTTLNKYGQSIENTIEKQTYPGKGQSESPLSQSAAEMIEKNN